MKEKKRIINVGTHNLDPLKLYKQGKRKKEKRQGIQSLHCRVAWQWSHKGRARQAKGQKAKQKGAHARPRAKRTNKRERAPGQGPKGQTKPRARAPWPMAIAESRIKINERWWPEVPWLCTPRAPRFLTFSILSYVPMWYYEIKKKKTLIT